MHLRFNLNKLGLEQYLLFACGALYVLLFLWFYPETYAISDEASYFSMAYVLKQGKIFVDMADMPVMRTVSGRNGHSVSLGDLGHSVLMIPFTIFGWKATFLTNLVLHLIGYLVFYKILKLLGYSGYLSFLYLFHPTFVLYSRTLMSDVSGAVFILIGFYLYLKGDKYTYFSGASFGVACFIRYMNVVGFIPLLIIAVIRDVQRKSLSNLSRNFMNSGALKLIVGFVPLAILILVYNYTAFGNPFVDSRSVSYEYLSMGETFNWRAFIPNAKFYLIALTIFYPLMWLALLIYRGKAHWELNAISVSFFVFYMLTAGPGALGGHDKGISVLKQLLTIRYLMPIIPLLLVMYVAVIERFFRRYRHVFRTLVAFVLAASLVMAIGVHYGHAQYLHRQWKITQTIYKNTSEGAIIICNRDTPEYIHPVWGDRQVYLYGDKWQIFMWGYEYLPYQQMSLDTLLQNTSSEAYIVFLFPPRSQKILVDAQSRLAELQRRYKTELKLHYRTDSSYELEIYKIMGQKG